MTFRNLIAVFLLLASTLSVSAQFFTETFSSQAAFNAWTAGSTGMGAQVWNRSTVAGDPMGFTTAPTAFAAPTAANGFAFYNSDANGDGNTHDVTLTSGPINCSSHTSVGLRFHSQFADFQGSTAQVRVSTNGGTTWTAYDIFDDQPSYGIGQGAAVPADILTEMAIPAANGQAQVLVQFRWEGFWEYGWKLDDIELYDYVAPVHDVTIKVNTALINVNPAGMWIIGTINNLTPAPMTDEGGGVWSYTVPLASGDYLYRFINGPNPANVENGLPLSSCGVANPTLGGFDRSLTVGTEDITLAAVCFNSCSACVLPCPQNPNKIVCDNINQYNTTQKLAQQNLAQNGAANSWWTTWSGTVNGGTEDGIVTTEQANSAPNSFKILTTATGGGPQDVVLKLGNKTSGRYELKWMYYVPTGKQAYYNIQNVVPIGVDGAWNLDAFFGAANAGLIRIGAGPTLATFTYPSNEWFEVRHIIDLDNNLLTLWVDGQYVHKMAYPNNLGGIDFFGIDNNHTNYIDDVEYVSLPPLVYNVDVCDAAVDLTLFFGQPLAQTTGIYDNTTATVAASDPSVDCWLEVDPGVDILNTTMWYTFVGDGQKYHIETVPCDATSYIAGPGDTQMAIYAGDDCNDLTEIACNDDLNPTLFQDYRAGVDLQTDPGQNYYMLIDGFQNQGIVATGEFCIEITKIASVLCADGAVGTFEAASEVLCFNSLLSDILTVDPSGFVLPNEGIVAGLSWAISAQPLDPGVYPADDPNYLGSFQVLPDVYEPGVPNDNSSFMMAGNLYYFTPVVIGNGDNGGLPNFLHNIDISNGCYYVGESVPVAFLPLTAPITATTTVGASSITLTPGGGISDIIGDNFYFTYLWSNGATTQNLTNVPLGTYTVTVSDPCTAPKTASATILVSSTVDPASIQSFVISPNPTSGILTLNLELATAAEVRIEVLNTLGQTLQSLNVGKLSNLSQNVDLGNMAQGSYFLRVTVDGETAIRRVVVQR